MSTATGKATQIANQEAQIRKVVDDWANALRAKDIEGLMAHYAPDVLVFGLVAPLDYKGVDAHRKHWKEMFNSFEGPIGYEIRDLRITTDDNVAFSHCLNRIRGTMRSGEKGGAWVRVTVCYRKIDGKWKVTHEHVSVPFDIASGKALVDLEP